VSQPFIGQIMIAAFNFAPQGWAFCNGQIMSIQQNTALFSLLGTTYGGDGQTNFALPNLQSRIPVHFGQGLGLTPYVLGEMTGSETRTLITQNLPAHNHQISAVSGKGNKPSPAGALPAADAAGITAEYSSAAANTTMNPTMVSLTGGNQPFSILPPVLALNFVIALFGVFPSRS
jgi:microcystin-dependent protein